MAKQTKNKAGAPVGNKNALGNEGGRPTDYREEYNLQAFKLSLLGAKDKELADFFGVTKTTLENWKKEHIEFFDSIREGKKKADMTIAESLYKTAQDRIVVKQVPIKCKEVSWKDGKRIEKEKVVVTDIEETIPADFRSIQFWLKNRRPKNFRDKQEVDHTTKGESFNQIVLGKGIQPPQD